mgnify:CR=1 FL=1
MKGDSLINEKPHEWATAAGLLFTRGAFLCAGVLNGLGLIRVFAARFCHNATYLSFWRWWVFGHAGVSVGNDNPQAKGLFSDTGSRKVSRCHPLAGWGKQDVVYVEMCARSGCRSVRWLKLFPL